MPEKKTIIKVIPVTIAKPFLESKIKKFKLLLSLIEDKIDSFQQNTSKKSLSTIRNHFSDYTIMLKNLNNEFLEIFKDYTGFDNPPVVSNHIFFKNLNKDDLIPARDGQYFLGSLESENETGGKTNVLFSKLLSFEKEISIFKIEIDKIINNQTNNSISSESQEILKTLKFLETQFLEFVKSENNHIKLLNDLKQNFSSELKKISQRLGSFEKKQEIILKDEIFKDEYRLILKKIKEHFKKNEIVLDESESIYQNINDFYKKIDELFENKMSKLEKIVINLNDSTESERNEFVDNNMIIDLKKSIEKHHKLIKSMEMLSSRLNQDKSWIKGLLKGLLDQQERFQNAENRIFDRERESIIRENNIKQEKGWSKIEKSKKNDDYNIDEIVDP